MSNKNKQGKKKDTRSIAEKKARLLEALEKSLGVITDACKMADLNRDTFYRYLREDEDFKAKYEDISNVALDFVESKMYELIRQGDKACIIFYMKCKGKKRGYVEKEEKQVSNVPQIIIQNDLNKDTNN